MTKYPTPRPFLSKLRTEAKRFAWNGKQRRERDVLPGAPAPFYLQFAPKEWLQFILKKSPRAGCDQIFCSITSPRGFGSWRMYPPPPAQAFYGSKGTLLWLFHPWESWLAPTQRVSPTVFPLGLTQLGDQRPPLEGTGNRIVVRAFSPPHQEEMQSDFPRREHPRGFSLSCRFPLQWRRTAPGWHISPKALRAPPDICLGLFRWAGI